MSETMSKEPITSDMLCDVRWEIPNVVTELGAISDFLREAISDTNDGNVRGAAMVCDDMLEAFVTLETRLSSMAVEVAEWKAVAEQDGGEA